MALQQDVASARKAVRDLEKACTAIYSCYGSGIDVRRLRADVKRLSEDIDLLCGPEPEATAARGVPGSREVIEDRAYAADFWQDAEDEGLGAAARPGR